MKIEYRCPSCDRVLHAYEHTTCVQQDVFVLAHAREAERDAQTIHCRCGQTVGCRDRDERDPRGKARGLVAEVVGTARLGVRGRLDEIPRLRDEHARRGGKFSPPKRPKPPTKDGRGGVTINGVHVPPGQTVEVDGVLVDTTGGRVRVVHRSSVAPAKEKP